MDINRYKLNINWKPLCERVSKIKQKTFPLYSFETPSDHDTFSHRNWHHKSHFKRNWIKTTIFWYNNMAYSKLNLI